jgi:excisionase family DNA binding protein
MRVDSGEHPNTDEGVAMQIPAEKLAFTIAEAVSSTGIGRTKLYALIKQGQLETRKLGARTLIPATSLRSLVAALPRSPKHPA